MLIISNYRNMYMFHKHFTLLVFTVQKVNTKYRNALIMTQSHIVKSIIQVNEH